MSARGDSTRHVAVAVAAGATRLAVVMTVVEADEAAGMIVAEAE